MNEINSPSKLSLAQFTDLPSFQGTEDGQTEIQNMEEANKKYKSQLLYCKIAKWACYILGVMTFTNYWYLTFILWAVGFFGFRINGFVPRHFTAEHSKAVDRYYNYWDQLAGFVGNKFLSDWRYNRFGLRYMIYGNEGLVYLDVDQDLLVSYNKSNIKDVTRERVHTGSHTTSDTTGIGVGTGKTTAETGWLGGNYLRTNSIGVGKARTKSDTTDFYDWHFDVMTDFMQYPKVSVVINDTPENEDMINKMYAILKP